MTFACPWKQQYSLLPSHLRSIIGPCPSPLQIFQSLQPSISTQSGSDGSVLDGMGYQGWLIATLNNEILLDGFGATDGTLTELKFVAI
jgi:hypothetical protein